MFGSKTLKTTLIGTSALVAAAFLAAPTPARASPCITTVTGATTGPISVCAGTSLTVSNSGTVTSGGTGIVVDHVGATSISNSGHITSDDTGIFVKDTGALSGSITNSGTISADGTGIRVETNSAVTGAILNSGTIKSSGSGIAVTSSAVAGGIRNTGHITSGGSGIYIDSSHISNGIVNSGTINAANDRGIYIDDSTVTGGILNSGKITSSESGIYVDESTISGGITNSGTINADYGLYVEDNTVNGDIVNSGTINATDDTGLYIYDNSQINGSIINSGTINADDYGMYVSDNTSIGGSVINSGTINSGDTGMYVSENSIAGGITNSGTIKTDDYGLYVEANTIGGAVTNSGHITSDDTGMYIYDNTIGGGIVNSGSIKVTGGDYGMYIYDNTSIGGDIVNSGTITSPDTGMYVYDNTTITGSVINSGSIKVTSGDYGMYVGENTTVGGDIVNSGTITSPDTGMYVYDNTTITGSVINSGSIKVTGGDYGMYVDDNTSIGGDIVNSGTITSPDTGMEVDSNDIGGSVTNSGTINAANGYGMYVSDNDISGSVTNSGTINAANDYGMYVYDNDIYNGVLNSGKIAASDTALYVYDNYIVGGVTNTGTIISTGDAGVGLYDNTLDFFTNSGTIRGAWAGVAVTGTISGAFTNTGSIAATGTAGLEVYNNADITGGIHNSGTITGPIGIWVTGSKVSGGITNDVGGVIRGTTGTAIKLTGLTGLTPIIVNGGSIIGNVVDDTPGNFYTPVTVNGDFTTDGNWTVSSVQVTTGNLGIRSGDVFTVSQNTTTSTGTFTFGVGNGTAGELVNTGGELDLSVATIAAKVDGASPAGQYLIGHGTAAIDSPAGPGTGYALTTLASSSYLWGFKIVDGTDAVDLTAPSGSADDLYLLVNQNHTLASAANSGANASIGATLEGLNGTTANPQLQDIIDNLNNAGSAQGVNDVLSSAGPTIDASDEAGATDVSGQTLGLTNDRLASLRTGDDATGMAAGNMPHGMGAWGQAFGQHANQGERDGIAGFNANTYGAAVGIDTSNVGDQKAILGVAFAYGRTNANSDNANSTDTNIDSYQVALYGNLDLHQGFYLNGMGSFGWDNNERTRHDAGGTGLDARASYNARQFDVLAEAGKDMIYNGMTLTPNVTAHWVNWDPDSYTETGAGGADLRVNGSTLNQFELGGGVKAGWSFKGTDGSWIKPQLRIGYRYALTDDQINDTAQFAGGGGAFTVDGANPARSAVDIGASVKYLTVRNWDFTASADFDWRDNYTAEAGFLRAAYKF